MNIKAIYFDLDDTLCGYWDAGKGGLRAAFTAHMPDHDIEVMLAHWATVFRDFAPRLRELGWYETYLATGEPTRTEQMRLTLERVGIVDPGLAARLSHDYLQERHARLRLFDDAVEVLDALRRHYPLGLITNGPADIQRLEIEVLGIGHYFDHVFIEGEMKEGKPSPTVFARAAAAMACTPGELLMVGNSYKQDIAPALAAGWHAIWIRRPSDVPPSAKNDAKPEEMPMGGQAPDAEISHLIELLPILSS